MWENSMNGDVIVDMAVNRKVQGRVKVKVKAKAVIDVVVNRRPQERVKV